MPGIPWKIHWQTVMPQNAALIRVCTVCIKTNNCKNQTRHALDLKLTHPKWEVEESIRHKWVNCTHKNVWAESQRFLQDRMGAKQTQISLPIRAFLSVFAAHYLGRQESKAYSCEQRRLWSDCADVHADLSLRWAYMQSCRKYCVPNHHSIKWSLYQIRAAKAQINLSSECARTSLRIRIIWPGPSFPKYRINIFFFICVLRPFQEYFTYRADRSSKTPDHP